MAKPNSASAPAEKLAQYEKLVATNPAVERKGATVPYTAVNGNMFSYLAKSGTMALRLPPKEREEFIEKFQTRLCQQYGIVQAEYVEVPPDLLAATGKLKEWFGYVSSLKPKPSAKASSKTKKKA